MRTAVALIALGLTVIGLVLGWLFTNPQPT